MSDTALDSTGTTDPKEVESVHAKVAFLNGEWKHKDEKARIYDRASRHGNTTKLDLEVINGRHLQRAGKLDLDRNGFILMDHEPQFSNWDDDDAIKAEYFQEMAAHMKNLTGCEEAIPHPFYVLRKRKPTDFFDAYSLYMHYDFPERRWSRMAEDTARETGFPQYTADRYDFVLYTLWRPLYEAIQQDPLTVGDASTIDPSDILEYRLAKDGTKSMAELPVHAPDQRYYYFPRMEPNEVLIFKQQDTRDGVAKYCPHTSFADPNAPENPVHRRSIDMRVMCVFPKK